MADETKTIKIKQKNVVKNVKTLDRAALVTDRMKKVVVRAKEEAGSAANGGGDHSEASYAVQSAEDGAKDTVYVAMNAAPRGRKRQGSAQSPANTKLGKDRAIKQKTQKAAKGSKQTVKAAPTRYQRQEAAKTAGAKTASGRMKQKAVKDAARALVIKKAQGKAAARSARATAKAFIRMVRGIIAALRRLILMISSGGIVAVVVCIFIIIIAALLVSAFGIFFSNETGEGMAMGAAIETLTDEFSGRVEQIISDNPHDELEMVYVGGDVGVDWKSVIAIYSVKTTEDPDNPIAVLALGEENFERLRTIFNDMNAISYSTRTETRTRTVTAIDPDTGETYQTTDTVSVTVLTVTVTKKASDEMAAAYGFTKSQKDTLAEILSPDYDALWEGLLGAGAYRNANGERRQPSADRRPTGIFSWPLEQVGTITSWFGWREDPISGETKYHEGVDIAVPHGTPILAAADGTVTMSNATDSYGGGWGYYVKIRHGSGFETLYAHCSAVAVRSGETVTKGQIIGYVGSTGRSTGNHLHFEVYLNGSRVDPLSYFE